MKNRKLQDVELELEEKFLDRVHQKDKLCESYKRLGYEKKAAAVMECGTELTFLAPSDPELPQKLYRANFCKDRLCPMCSWRRTKKIFGQVSKIMDKLDEEYEFVFVTLTVLNCSSAQLRDYIKRLFKAFDLFNHYKEVRQAFKGYFRTLEITRHEDRIRSIEWHPHFHAIYAVKPSYFRSRYYIDHDKLMHLWQRAFQTSYDPRVYIEKVKPKENDKRYTEEQHLNALHEVAKYSAKSFEYLTCNDEDTDRGVGTLLQSLTTHRLCGMGGVFRKAAQELKLDDMIDGDLVNTDNEEIRADLNGILMHYQWRVGAGYQLVSTEDFQEYKARQKAEEQEACAFYQRVKKTKRGSSR